MMTASVRALSGTAELESFNVTAPPSTWSERTPHHHHTCLRATCSPHTGGHTILQQRSNEQRQTFTRFAARPRGIAPPGCPFPPSSPISCMLSNGRGKFRVACIVHAHAVVAISGGHQRP